jgi:ABC-type glycerol-3-phosphate transport system substrate-binding protein
MRRMIGAVAVVALLGLAACGGGEESNAQPEGAAVNPQPEVQQPAMDTTTDTTQVDTTMARDTAGAGGMRTPQ